MPKNLLVQKILRNFAAEFKTDTTMVATMTPQMGTYSIHVPNFDFSRFKGIAEAMNWSFEEAEPAELDYWNHPTQELLDSVREAREGNTHHASSIDDLFQQCLGEDYVRN